MDKSKITLLYLLYVYIHLLFLQSNMPGTKWSHLAAVTKFCKQWHYIALSEQIKQTANFEKNIFNKQTNFFQKPGVI